MEDHIFCPECGAIMVLRNSKHGPFYGCSTYPKCKGSHGAHPDGRPLGKPATRETKQWRIKSHDAFDILWKKKHMSRDAAYLWMQAVMGLPVDEAHIGSYDIDQCQELIKHVETYLKEVRKGKKS